MLISVDLPRRPEATGKPGVKLALLGWYHTLAAFAAMDPQTWSIIAFLTVAT
ncbi:hypothetical protein ABIA99_004274 [Bradyrhizobium sp. LB12.1]|uniref:hypothetical protein n=1 Tax=Bradyrhizobium sp. LB12.1 TaxID=3156327 RepID=UPI00339788F3